MLQYVDFFDRKTVEADKDCIYLFGDNFEHWGTKGQACIRGLPNAVGIPTKLKPSMSLGSFLSDTHTEDVKSYWNNIFSRLPKDKVIKVSKFGLGTGLAKLPEKAPKLYEYLQKKLKEFE